MKLARVGVLGLAVGSAGIAALIAKGMVSGSDDTETAQKPQIETVRVLVASEDIGLGVVVGASAIKWQNWPREGLTSRYITESDTPKAMSELTGAAARAPILAGEPIVREKLVTGANGGFMSAILPSGMRAISVKISPETGAGGFILPNDRVDVILTRRQRDASSGNEVHRSTTVLTNVRVLAIDQAIEKKNSKEQVVVGKTATLELHPNQAEALALAESTGNISLSLRSLADSTTSEGEGPMLNGGSGKGRKGAVSVLRYGVSSSIETVR